MNPPDLYVIGATTRAIADMARRAGFSVGCFDAYCDLDLVENNAFSQAIDLRDCVPGIAPEDFRRIVDRTPWLYAGPIENAHEWLEAAAEKTTLWGNSADTCRALRDPFALSDYLRSSGSPIRMPETRRIADRPRGLNQWLCKPLRGAGGWEVCRARKILHRFSQRGGKDRESYWQKFVPGPTYGATIASDGRNAVILGLCESRSGSPGRPFAYESSIGPIRGRRVNRLMPVLADLASRMAEAFVIKGLWNLDLAFSVRTDRWFLLEVNPRPSASMEVLEMAAHVPLISLVRDIFGGRSDWAESAHRIRLAIDAVEFRFKKNVVYVPRKTVVTANFRHIPRLGPEHGEWPAPPWFRYHADIPHPGTVIASGEPKWTIVSRVSPFLTKILGRNRKERLRSDEQNVVSRRKNV